MGSDWSADDRRELADLDQLLRSLALSPRLPPEQLARLLARHRSLLQERHEIEQALTDLGPTWQETKAALNHLHSLLRSSTPPDADRTEGGAD